MQGYQQRNPLAPSCAVGSAVSDSATSSLIGGISEKRVDNQFDSIFNSDIQNLRGSEKLQWEKLPLL